MHEAHKKLIANTTKHVVDNEVVSVTFTVIQDKISGIGEEHIMYFLENHDLSQLTVQSIFEKMCQIQESRATDQQFKVEAYSPLALALTSLFSYSI